MIVPPDLGCALTGWCPGHDPAWFVVSVGAAVLAFMISMTALSASLARQAAMSAASGMPATPASGGASVRPRDLYWLGASAGLLSLVIIPVFGAQAPELAQFAPHSSLRALVAIAYAVVGFLVLQTLVGVWNNLGAIGDPGRPTQQPSTILSERPAPPLWRLIALGAAFVAWRLQGPPQWLIAYVACLVIAATFDLAVEGVLSAWRVNPAQPPAQLPTLAGLRATMIAILVVSGVIVGYYFARPTDALGLFVRHENPIMYVGALIAMGFSVVLACGASLAVPSVSAYEFQQATNPNLPVRINHFSPHADQLVKIFLIEIPLIYGFWVAMSTPVSASPLPIPPDLVVAEIPLAAACGVLLHGLLALGCVVALICVWAGEALGLADATAGGGGREARSGLHVLLRLVTLPVALLWAWLHSWSLWPDLAPMGRAIGWRRLRSAGGASLRWLNRTIAPGAGDEFICSGVFLIALLFGSAISVLSWEYNRWPIAYLVPAELLLAALAFGAARHALLPQRTSHPYRTCMLSLTNTIAITVALTLIVSTHDIGALPAGWNTAFDLLLVYTILALTDSTVHAFLHFIKAADADFVGNPLRWEFTLLIVGPVSLIASTGECATITANTGLTGAVCLEAGIAAMVYLFLRPLIDLAVHLGRRAAIQPDANQELRNLVYMLVEAFNRKMASDDPKYVPPSQPTTNPRRRVRVRKPTRATQFTTIIALFAYLITFHLMFIDLGLSYFFNVTNVTVDIPLVALAIGFYWPLNPEIDAERRPIALFFLITVFFLFAASALGSPMNAIHSLGESASPLSLVWSGQFDAAIAHIAVLEGLFLLALGQLGFLFNLTRTGIQEAYRALRDDN